MGRLLALLVGSFLLSLVQPAHAVAFPGWQTEFSLDYQPPVGYGENLNLPGDGELSITAARVGVGYTWVPHSKPPPPGSRRPFGTPLVWWENKFSFTHTHFDDGYLSEFTAGQDSFSTPGWFSRAGWRFEDDWSIDLIAGLDLPVDDLSDAEFEDLQFQGGLGITWYPNERSAFGLGLFYQQLTGESRVLPFPTVVWFSETMKHNVTMLGPRASYTYALNRKHQVSGIFRLAGNQFVYTGREVPLYDGDGNIREASVRPALAASAFVLAVGYSYRPIPPWSFRVEVGSTVGRRLEFTDRDGRTLRLADGTPLDLEPDPGLVFTLAGNLRF